WHGFLVVASTPGLQAQSDRTGDGEPRHVWDTGSALHEADRQEDRVAGLPSRGQGFERQDHQRRSFQACLAGKLIPESGLPILILESKLWLASSRYGLKALCSSSRFNGSLSGCKKQFEKECVLQPELLLERL